MSSVRAVVLRPSTWVAAAVISIALSSSSTGAGPLVTVSDLVLGVLVCVAALQLLRGGNAAVVRSVPALLFGALGLISVGLALVAPNFPGNVVGGVRFLQLFCLTPIAVMVALRSRTDTRVVLGSVVGLAVVQGAVGIVQALTRTGAGIGGQPIRAVGTFGAYNIGALAGLCALGLLICLAWAVVLPGVRRWWAAAGAAFLVLPLAFSLSRSAWLATAVAAIVVVSRGRPARMLGIVVAGVVLGAAAVPVVLASQGELADRLDSLITAESDPDQSFVDRLSLWHAAAGMALDHPWTGVGPHAFVDHRDAYADLALLGSSDIALGSDFEQVALESPHNFYLLVASELGLVAAAVFVASFLVVLGRGLVRSARPRQDEATATSLAGVGMLAFALVGMLTSDLGGPWSILLAVLLGVAGWAAADQELDDGLPAAATAGARVPVAAGSAP
ncbi:O-antigen ligase [Blastococcus sp. TF02-8]|uniref:O-antigen ligase family protein n=1 Tax=Blastococcus sp. TF02-8 TaxID=2250574 RepID=UPI0014136B97|nr:O-antigen ligase family protein [Blastococcus sp. TF02-8]